ncbi:hypothetical protein [Streptomyces sp. G-G2]|uniref:hypothetical protein n=1 Tax=Streptomyces sp. G-G2 TaxID=3046201 RepID=UPI0024B993AF|nr:hypothetical protein [Streptomyces sp. G-G2]MDJ0384264.1 hypothetical protein [Streptomyces sp. G-G2]
MSRPRVPVWCLLGAVLAVLLGCAAPAGARPAVDPPRVTAMAATAYAGQGPACAPGTGGHEQAPAVPPRAGQGGDHAQVPPGRVPAEREGDAPGRPARVLVRGPDRPAPGPLELSVMRV